MSSIALPGSYSYVKLLSIFICPSFNAICLTLCSTSSPIGSSVHPFLCISLPVANDMKDHPPTSLPKGYSAITLIVKMIILIIS